MTLNRLATIFGMTLFAILTAAPAAAAERRPTAEVLPPDLARALKAYDGATIRNDTKVLADLVTDDYLLVNSDSSVQDKGSYLADFAVPGFKVDPYTIEQPVYRVHGDAALTGGALRLGWTQDGRHESRRLRIAHFWVRQNGRWRIAYTQLTRVPE